MEVFELAAIVGAAAASTIAAVLWIMRSQFQHASPGAEHAPTDSDPSISILFECETLQHVSGSSARLLNLIPGRDDWTGVREKLATRFPSLPEAPQDASPGTTTILAGEADDTATLMLTRDGSYTRVNLLEDNTSHYVHFDRVKLLQREIAALKRASDTTSHAIWQEDADGVVTWYNAAYKELFWKLHREDPAENKPVFSHLPSFDHEKPRQRVSITRSGANTPDWYDLTAVRVGDVTVFHAVEVNAVVKSEVAQRNFVQTLAKTFAQLSIGLAIFDRNGQLALFNPALIDLTQLPADFLSSRPTLMSFFDRIRENRRMPEPKNYQSWRHQIAEVIAAATDGRYQETWTLESGQTYRVNGRPHPDGAIAFLIEDISAEISLTRNFRAELELGQSLMDSFDEALVVFSSSGVLSFCNQAYRDMWGADPGNSFADVTIQDCVAMWKELCLPGKDWDEVVEFVMDFGKPATLECKVDLLSGGAMQGTFTRIASGATILRCQLSETPAKKTPENEMGAQPTP